MTSALASQPSRAIYRVFLFGALATGTLGAFFVPQAPLLAFWLASSLAFGTYLSVVAPAEGLADRTSRIVLLFAALIPAGLFTTQVSAGRNASGVHLHVHGVLVSSADAVTIGAGLAGVDVVLPVSSTTQPPWRLKIVRSDSGWVIDNASDVEHVRLSPDPHVRLSTLQRVAHIIGQQRDPFLVPFGVVLANDVDRAVVLDSLKRPIDTISVVAASAMIHSAATGNFKLTPVNSRLDERFKRLLRGGTTLGALDAVGRSNNTGPLPSARMIRVQEVLPQDLVNGQGGATWSTLAPLIATSSKRLIVSAVTPYSVIAAGANNSARRIEIGDSTRVEVRHGGGVWRFDLVAMSVDGNRRKGLSVRFFRNPRMLDYALPGAEACPAGVACGLLSLRPLPSPVAHFALTNAGPDTSRFALLASVREVSDGIAIGTGDREVVVRNRQSLSPVPLAARTVRADGITVAEVGVPTHWLLVSAAASRFNKTWKMILVAVGLVSLLLFVHQMATTAGASLARASTSNEAALALGLTAILALTLTRVVIGARVALFPPYNDAGLDTAIGLVVATTVASIGLLLWPRWLPQLLGMFDVLCTEPWRRWWSVCKLRFSKLNTVGRPRRRGSRIQYAKPIAILFAAFVALSLASRSAVLRGLFAGAAVLSTWLVLAWVSAFGGGGFHAFAASPTDVIELDDAAAANIVEAPQQPAAGSMNSEQATAVEHGKLHATPRRVFGPNGQIALLCVIWAITLKSPLLGCVGALVIGIIEWLMFRRQKRANQETNGKRVWCNFAIQLLSVGMLALLRMKSENGAMATFLLVILIALISVRFGRALAGRIARDSNAHIKWTTIAAYLLLPLLLLGFSLAVIDMGLLLVTVIPIGAASLLAVGWRSISRGGKLFAGLLYSSLVLMLVVKVLFPRIGAIGDANATVAQQQAAFNNMQRVFGIPIPVEDIRRSLARAASRAVATADPQAAERLLFSAEPGLARDLLMPSIEQAWGGRVYSASGLTGHGLGTAPIGGHGIAEPVSYAENSFAVYVLYEHGALGGCLVLLAYMTFIGALMSAMRSSARTSRHGASQTASLRASRALFLVAALLVAFPAAYVALSNLGIVPITGQNMPFLGLNSWSDVTLCAGIVGMLLAGAVRTQATQRRLA